MIREVYIDNKLVDVENNSATGYIFSSPIFRDISYIMSNRTTTYKLPKTSHNLTIFGLSDNPDVVSDFPYMIHDLKEYREGILFIKGQCALLKVGDSEMELSVIWGNTVNIMDIKDKKLRELDSLHSIRWNSSSGFLNSDVIPNRPQYGFVQVDFGKGLSDFQYIHPSVTMQYILDLITSTTGVTFNIPLTDLTGNELLKKMWIPLIDKNADALTWEDYTVEATFDKFNSSSTTANIFFIKTEDNKHNIIQNGEIYWRDKPCKIVLHFDIEFHDNNPKMEDGAYMNAITGVNALSKRFENNVGSTNGIYKDSFDFEYDFTEIAISIQPKIGYLDKNGNRSRLNDPVIDSFNLTVSMQQDEMEFGDSFSITPNLPDITVSEYLKSIMQMFGLYVYYDYSKSEDQLYFASIDTMYAAKSKAYNWTNNLLNTTRGRFNITFRYGDYTRNNSFKYKKDDTVLTDANGYVTVNNTAIVATEKELITLPYAASDNDTIVEDSLAGDYSIAKIKLYNSEGETEKVEYRVLSEVYHSDDNGIYLGPIGAVFDESLKFNGDNGILKKYYTEFQRILNRPIVVEFYVRLDNLDLATFDALRPVYIDGTYYMILELTSQIDGDQNLCTVKAIKMPSVN